MVDTTVRTVQLGEREFKLPMLPPRANRTLYPLMVRLEPLVKRTVAGGFNFEPTQEEFGLTLDAVFQACNFADPSFTFDDFDNLPVKPQAYFDALLQIRLATGGWVIKDAGEGDGVGEAKGQTP